MASTWSDLKFELIGTGEQSGTWGTTTNANIGDAIEQAIGGKADVTMSSTSITISLTDTTALQNARALYLNLTGTPGGAATLNVPAVQKSYIVYNNTTGGFAVTVKVSGQTGVSVPNGKVMVLYDNGTDVVDAITHLSSLTLGSALAVASGGTGVATLTANNVVLGNGTSAVQFVAPGSVGNVLTSNGTTWTSSAPASTSPGGSTTQVQFNNSGAFGGSSLLTFDGTTLTAPNTVISVNTTSDALRITQTGTGHALLVEDSANPDATPFVVNADGKIIIGATTPVADSTSNIRTLQFLGTSGSTTGQLIGRYSDNSLGGTLYFAKSRNSTIGSQTVLQSGDEIGRIGFDGSDGTSFVSVAQISASVDGTPGSGAVPGRLTFITSPGGERMRIDSSGNLGLGVTPSAWQSSSKAYELGSAGTGQASWQITSSGYMDIFRNAYVASGGTATYKYNGYAQQYRQDPNGLHSWSVAPSGTAGNAITFTTAMTLDASGNLLVGTTSAVTGSKLVVDTGDATIYGVRVGRGAGAVSTNTAVGATALNANTTGTNNVAVGYQALLSKTTALYNTAVGTDSQNTGATGDYNASLGYQALYNNTGSNNTAIGARSMNNAANTGNNNTAIGALTLQANTSGANNVAVGYQSLVANTTASNNTAVGYQSLYANTTGTDNAFLGHLSGYSNTTASGNTGVGRLALYSNQTGTDNTAHGREALKNTTGSNNTAVGSNALVNNTTGTNNTAIGYDAGGSTTTGSKNTFLGRSAKASAATTDNEIVLGYNVVGQGDGYVTIGQGGLGKIYNAYYVNATWTQTSDGTMKNIVGPDTLGLSFINRLNPIKFTWKPQNELPTDHPYYAETNAKNTTTVIHGFVAQEVKAALDAEGCTTFNGWDQGPDGIQAISREMFISPLVKAVQELSAQVETLKAEIATLKGA